MDASWSKIILHVDMDAFFASVEQLLHPEWKDRPVIVGADPKEGRGVVSAASYEARKFGVHSAMPISRAFKLCPQGIFVRPHGHQYSSYSQKIFKIFHTFSPKVQPLSIDEAFLDASGSLRLFKSVKNLGKKIKSEIKSQTGLTGSVGIAPSKSVAKIASDFDKPDGLTIVAPGEVQAFLDPLPVSKLWGVGKKMQESLEKMGIFTAGMVRRYPLEVWRDNFGKMGVHIYKMARGDDQREVHPGEEAKSVSNEVTFSKDVSNPGEVRDTIFALAEKVSGRLRRAGFSGQTVHLKIRFHDFKTFTRSYTLGFPTNLTHEIFETVCRAFLEFEPLPQPVRLVGVGVSNLVAGQGRQLTIWDAQKQKILKLERVVDQIQDKFGKDAITHARSLEARKRMNRE